MGRRPNWRPCFDCGELAKVWGNEETAYCEACIEERKRRMEEEKKMAQEEMAQAGARFIARQRGD
jgi:hypothetical protein